SKLKLNKMKSRIVGISFLLIFFCTTLLGQTGARLNYQAIVRNSSYEPLANQQVSFRFSILDSGGGTIYSGTQTTTTNDFGMVVMKVGESNPAAFEAIDWTNTGYSLKVECDPSGGTAYITEEITRLNPVPYALYGRDEDADPANELQTISKSGSVVTLSGGGGSFTDAVNDADASISNELISTVVLNGTILEITEAGVKKSVDLGDFADQILSYNTGTHILTLTDGGSVNLSGLINDADASTTNEIQTISKTGNLITLSLSGGTVIDEVDDADHDISNELQSITKSGNTITLSNGGGSVIDDVNDADHDPANEMQTLSLSGDELSISGANSVTLSSQPSPWVKTGSDIYFNTGKIGVGTDEPQFNFHLMAQPVTGSETILRAMVADDPNGYLEIGNGTTWDENFIPSIIARRGG
ncbi:MAG: hypothetical protein R2727_12240, partial [Bacteroidales bacterium]